MRRDKVDDILAKRLAGHREEPPAGLWEELRQELEARDAAQEPLLSERIRRRTSLNGGTMLKFGIAAAFLIGVFLMSRYLDNEQEPLLAEEQAVIETQAPAAVIEEGIIEVAQAAPGAAAAARLSVEQLAVAAENYLLTIPGGGVAAGGDTGVERQPERQPEQQSERQPGPTGGLSDRQVQTRSGTPGYNIFYDNDAPAKARRERRPMQIAIVGTGMPSSRGYANMNGGYAMANMLTANSAPIYETMPGWNFSSGWLASASAPALAPEMPTHANATSHTPTPESLRHHFPLSAGIEVGIRLSERLSLRTGVTYTYLRSDVMAAGSFNYDITQNLHYVGIPVAVAFDIIERRGINFYLRGGAALEKAVVAERVTKVINPADGRAGSRRYEKLDAKGLQPSLSASIGGDVALAGRLSLFVEPGISYHFVRAGQPASYRSENPLGFSLRTGLKYNFY